MKQDNLDDHAHERNKTPDHLNDRLDRLDRLEGHLGVPLSASSTDDNTDNQASPSTDAPPRYHRLADALGGDLINDFAGCYCIVTQTYPFGSAFGDTVVPALPESPSIELFETELCNGVVDIGNTVFLDTETTGLGGVGAVPFLIGCGSVTERGFEIRQYVLPDYTDEAAMLERVLAEFGGKRFIVTYNGRAFDVPLVRDRMIVNRIARAIPHAHHVDLLYSARRLWRRRLQDCSLTNIEREVFGFYREDDIPGYLVPSVYFDWLGSEDVGLLPSVLEHNRLDILTLYILLAKVADIFGSEGAGLEHVDDMYSLSRVFERRRQRDKVTEMYQRIDEQSPDSAAPDVIWFHSLAFKRQGDWDQAVRLWQSLVEVDSREAFRANVELAKYFEHRVKDAAEAYRHARQAAALCPSGGRDRENILNRLRRLKERLA